MILATAQNEAVLGNVQDLGEFRIRNSAKAFSILSSGLYANKIRAVIRELSCNAVDSHVDAGKADVPFELHLPTTLEPFFAIRDYGTGLTHSQVTTIYTTYFESTKTDSNAFIGALGLGSKSPFSYTDNFSIVAIKDGIKNIYTAYLNESGVPSVALMTTSETDELSGVEVRFAVEKHNDFYNFRQEARHVYKFFALRPIVTGETDFTFVNAEYAEKDIIPGVHLAKDSYTKATAIMGNIAYPIEISDAEAKLGKVASLLKHPLIMHFTIGELDFQASREGLSYIPSTIEAIKTKLEAVNAQLEVHISEKVSKIKNVWEKTIALRELQNQGMFQSAVKAYCETTKFVMYSPNHDNYYRNMFSKLTVSTKDIAKKYNVALTGSYIRHGYVKADKISTRSIWDKVGNTVADHVYDIEVYESVYFVVNDTTKGATERAKYHYRKNTADKNSHGSVNVFVIEAADKTKPVQSEKFLKSLHNPINVAKASTLEEKPRKVVTTNTSGLTAGVLKLTTVQRGYSTDTVWRSAGTVADFINSTVYYVPLSGFNALMKSNAYNAYSLQEALQQSGVKALQNITLYGVRKGDMKAIEGRKNWVNIETYLKKALITEITDFDIAQLSEKKVGKNGLVCYYNEKIANLVTDKNSDYLAVSSKYDGVTLSRNNNTKYIVGLCAEFCPSADISTKINTLVGQCEKVSEKYPLLRSLNHYDTDFDAVAHYVNMIDKTA